MMTHSAKEIRQQNGGWVGQNLNKARGGGGLWQQYRGVVMDIIHKENTASKKFLISFCEASANLVKREAKNQSRYQSFQ